MMRLKVLENLSDAAALYASLGDLLAPDVSMALNSAARGVKTDAGRAVPEAYGIEKATFKEKSGWKVRPAYPDDPVAVMEASGPRLGLKYFNPTPNRLMEGITHGGVEVSIKGNKHRFKHAFMGTRHSDSLNVMQREKGKSGKGQRRLKHLTAVSIPQMADDEEIVAIVSKGASERFLKQFDHLMDRLIKEFS